MLVLLSPRGDLGLEGVVAASRALCFETGFAGASTVRSDAGALTVMGFAES